MSNLKIIPLGGGGNVTKNMFVYEYDNQVLLVDCGIGFPTSDMPGIDVLIPDVSYLHDGSKHIVGMVLTHAHDDHIAALPYILPQLPDFPIYGSKLTIGFAADRLDDFDFHHKELFEFPDRQSLDLGPFRLQSIHVTHSVPDARHYAIGTPAGTVYHGSDFKFDLTPVDGVISDYQKIARIGGEGVLCLLSDSLRSEKPGHSLSEAILSDTFEREIRDTKGKFIVTAMSSNVHRIQQAVNVATSHGRQVTFIGRSVERNIKTAIRLGFFHAPKSAIINKKKIASVPANKLCVIIAGSQGQPGSSLTRAAIGAHTLIDITPEDKVVFSTEPIPGNENDVYSAIDNLSKIGADISYSDVDDDLHVSGHASALEQKLLIALTKPKFLYPIGGTYRHQVQYRKLATSMGYQKDRVFLMQDQETLELTADSAQKGDKLNLKNVMVDGLGVGDVGNIVLSDRKTMAASGIVIISVPVSRSTGQVNGEVQVISRGFVFMKQAGELIDKIKQTTRDCLQDFPTPAKDWANLRKKIDSKVGSLLFDETQREPLILPVLMEI